MSKAQVETSTASGRKWLRMLRFAADRHMLVSITTNHRPCIDGDVATMLGVELRPASVYMINTNLRRP